MGASSSRGADAGEHAVAARDAGGATHREVRRGVPDDRRPVGRGPQQAAEMDDHVAGRLDGDAVVGARDRVDGAVEAEGRQGPEGGLAVVGRRDRDPPSARPQGR